MMESRKSQALNVRISAAELAASRPHPRHVANDDEQKFRREVPNDGCEATLQQKCERPECQGADENRNTKFELTYLGSFTKGLAHDEETGLICTSGDFQLFVRAIDSGDVRDFQDTPLGPKGFDGDDRPWTSQKAQSQCGGKGAQVRGWESQGSGLTFDLEGPDAQAVTMPLAPAIGSDELTAEMAEVYVQALLRDIPFSQIDKLEGTVIVPDDPGDPCDFKRRLRGRKIISVKELIACLNELPWFQDQDCCGLTPAEASRKRGPFGENTAFRGITPGDNVGPYISQFLLAGNAGINPNDAERCPEDGFITYGGISIDQRVRTASQCVDYMQTWNHWLDVQNGADLRGLESYVHSPARLKRRFITTPRDLATYVHYDALYEAYLNACLLLLASGVPFDPGIPFQRGDLIDHQQGFAQFGGPHILSLVTEVATRALKAVRFQKFNVHRRLRPEALAGRIARRNHPDVGVPELLAMLNQPAMEKILQAVADFNPSDPRLPQGNFLLPMAFCEGSPMHPSYGAGHATVAGACITILKAFFDHRAPLAVTASGNPRQAFVPNAGNGGQTLNVVDVLDDTGAPTILTVEGELNKLASNISIGRDWAGVHFFTDYIESIRLGEQIALGILEEQKLTYGENFSMTVPLYDGGSIRI